MLLWAVESGKVSDLKPPGHVLSATGCVVVAKVRSYSKKRHYCRAAWKLNGCLGVGRASTLDAN